MEKFKEHDPVTITSQPENIGPRVGMAGYIEEIHDDDYYTFVEIATAEGSYFRAASGGIKGEHLSKSDNPELKKAIGIILEEQEKRIEEALSKGKEVRRRVEETAKEYNLTHDQAWELYDKIDKIRDEVHSPYYNG